MLWSGAGRENARKRLQRVMAATETSKVMANLEHGFIRGAMGKTAIVGCLASVVAFFVEGPWFGMSMTIGMVVAIANLWVVKWVSQKIIKSGLAGSTSSAPWSLLLVLKFFAIFGLIGFLLVVVEIDAIGFVAGFSSFLPALVWQAIIDRDDDSSDSGNRA